MREFTVFCQELGGGGTIWIEAVEAESVTAAAIVGAAACAETWEYAVEHVHVLGVAEGAVTILHWEDQYDG